MVAGIDRYFQIARCYRDEDLRGDRQPEFTQLDLEMSFVDEATVMDFVEALAIEVSEAITPDRPLLQVPFPRMTFEEAIERYGSDKPDIRFGMELVDLAPALLDGSGTAVSGFVVFDSTLAAGGRVKAIVAPGMAGITRREIDELTEQSKRFGAKGLAHLAIEPDGTVKGPIAKFLSPETQAAILGISGATVGRPDPDRRGHRRDDRRRPGPAARRPRRAVSGSPTRRSWPTSGSTASRCTTGTPTTSAGTPPTTRSAVSCPKTRRSWSPPSGDPARPSPADPAGRARALQYDLALNGWELGGGSIRIHRRELLERSFLLQGQTVEGMQEKFGAVLDAFEYGAPPHGGIALGIDRWAMIFAGQTNIREVMAFPKTQSGSDPMLDAPSVPEPGQYEELGLRYVGLPAKPS